MVKIMDITDSRGRGPFWEAYRACAEENKVRPDRPPFYVNWVKDFANFLPEKPLKERSFPLNNDMVQAPLSIQPRPSCDDIPLSKEDRGVKIFEYRGL